MARGKNEGSITRLKDGRYQARVTVGYDAKGNAKRRVAYGHTREEAAAKLTGLLSAKQNGTLSEPSRMTVAQAVARYIDNKVNADEGTRYKAGRESAQLLELIGSKRLQDLRTPHVRDAYTALAKLGLSQRAQSRAAMHLRAALREAVHEGTLARNPAEGVKVSAPRVDKEDEAAQAWTPQEVNLFLEAARGELVKVKDGGKKAKERKAKGELPKLERVALELATPDALFAVFYLMLALGLRRSEVLGLPWSAVDLEGGTLRVMQALSPVGRGGSFAIKPVKTPHSRRTLYLSHDVLALLRTQQVMQGETRALMGDGWEEHGLVFTTMTGTFVNPRNALRSFKRLLKLVAVTSIRLHDLRHTYASLSLHRGVPVEVVSERMGHARVDITLNIYRHLYEAERKLAALSLTDLLNPQPRALN